MNFNDVNRSILTQRYTSLVYQYEALNNEYDNCLEADRKIIISQKIAQIEADIRALDKHLSEEESRNILDRLHYIDFKEVIEELQKLLTSLGKLGGATVLVLQDSAAMSGDLLLKRLQEDLRNQSSKFNYIPIPFEEGVTALDERGFLSRLSEYLGLLGSVDQLIDLSEAIDSIIEALCASIQTRSIIFIEVKKWHNLPCQEKVFSWLCADFYPKLSRKIAEVVNQKSWRRVYVFLAIVSDDEFPVECMEGISCLNDKSNATYQEGDDSIFQIRLNNWSQEDIENWLEFSGLPDDKLENTANRLYSRSRQGIPLIVRDAIEREFSNR